MITMEVDGLVQVSLGFLCVENCPKIVIYFAVLYCVYFVCNYVIKGC